MNDRRRIEAALAANVREWRSRRGWSQSELASRAGLSKGMLVQVEQAQTNPSIATLCKLANALGIAMLKLVEVTDEPVVRRITPADVAWLWRGRTRGSAAGLIAGVETPVPVELWEWRIGARDGYDAIAHPAGTREFIYVLEGDAAVSVDGVEVVVATGECAVFQADRPHRYASAHGRATRFVMVVVEPIEPPGPSPPPRPARRRRPTAREEQSPRSRRSHADGFAEDGV